ncbi:MAG: hypothetical protein K6F68_04765 [Clostridiales bacterium]|nr:hypothetical protein [Clostridiales bacterium]
MEEIFDKNEALANIRTKFENQGDFDFMKPEELSAALTKLIAIDSAYMQDLGDEPYDEDVIYDRLFAAANETLPQYKTYLMRLVDDYMDFMEQYLVEAGIIEWE